MRDVRAVKSRFARDSAIQVGVIVLFVLLVLAGIYYMYRLFSHEQPTQSTYRNQQSNSVLGESSYKPLNLVINDSFTVRNNGSTYFSANITVKNDTADVQQFSPLLQFVAVDANGLEYPYTATLASQPMGGPINPGSSVSGIIDFSTAEGVVITSLRFRPTVDGEYQLYSVSDKQ